MKDIKLKYRKKRRKMIEKSNEKFTKQETENKMKSGK